MDTSNPGSRGRFKLRLPNGKRRMRVILRLEDAMPTESFPKVISDATGAGSDVGFDRLPEARSDSAGSQSPFLSAVDGLIVEHSQLLQRLAE